jgi:hypothetical protein
MIATTSEGWKGNGGTPLWDGDTKYAVTVMCPAVFPDSLYRLDLAPKTDKELRCNNYDPSRDLNYVQHNMNTRGGVFLHEMIHSQALFANAANSGNPLLQYLADKIEDYYLENDHTNPVKEPTNGYGPWNAVRLREVSRDSAPTMSLLAPNFNGDNYRWFVL